MKNLLWTLAGLVVLAFGVGSMAIVWLMTRHTLAGQMPTWVLGRAAGVASYVLLLLLVITGLVLSHPWARHLHLPSPRTRLTIHATLSLFTMVFVVLHLVALALDPWAKVGWIGALLPMASEYRPVAVSLGVLALWAGIITGVTARFAGRFAARYWWPIHKVAAALLLLVWAHSVFAGSDVAALTTFYIATGLFVLALAVTRYAARTPADMVESLTESLDSDTRTSPVTSRSSR
jgi:Ferric reductase like transmembrane component